MFEVALFGLAFLAPGVFAYALNQRALRGAKRCDHALGRERLNILLASARDAGFFFTDGDYQELGAPTTFSLRYDNDDLRCSLEITQKLDQVEVWFSAVGAGYDEFMKLPKEFSEAIAARGMIAEAQAAWDARKKDKLAAAVA